MANNKAMHSLWAFWILENLGRLNTWVRICSKYMVVLNTFKLITWSKFRSYLLGLSFPWYFLGKILRPGATDGLTDNLLRDLIKQERHPRIFDPVSKKMFRHGDFEGLQDEIYQNSFTIKTHTKHLMGRQPLGSMINAMNCEMSDPEYYQDTTFSKGNNPIITCSLFESNFNYKSWILGQKINNFHI